MFNPDKQQCNYPGCECNANYGCKGYCTKHSESAVEARAEYKSEQQRYERHNSFLRLNMRSKY